MPQRHSRNNNDLAIFTYEERRALGYGTQKERLGKDSVKPFDACSLCLKTVIDPMCCQKGHLFCKECIFECLLAQKKDIARQKALYEAQSREDREEQAQRELQKREAQLAAFDRQNNGALPTAGERRVEEQESAGFHGASSKKVTDFEAEAVRNMKAFWLPQLAPQAEVRVEAPQLETKCPVASEKLRLKDLFPVHFTPDKHADERPGAHDRFICPSCSSTFTNTSSLVAVSTCGHVLCSKCAQKFVEKEKACCVCAKPCKSRQLVAVEKGGTGFAGHGDGLVATAVKALGVGSGLSDVRPATRVT